MARTSKLPWMCCMVNPTYRCTFCLELLCFEHGKPWSSRRHFILDLCCSRFSEEELDQAEKCYVRRLAKQQEAKKKGRDIRLRLGNCKVCKTRINFKTRTDRNFTLDFLFG